MLFVIIFNNEGVSNMDFKKILFKTNTIDVDKALPDAMIFIDKDGKIQWVNDIAINIFETPKMHLMTSNISDFIENSMNIINNTITTNNSSIIKLNNKEMYFNMTAREIDEGFILDLRQADSMAEPNSTNQNSGVINRDKNNFLIKLSNDLKSPIQSIVGFSQAMSDGLGGNMSEQQTKYVKIINKNSSELMYFIEKLLELSYTESAIKNPDKKTIDVLALVNSVVKFNEQLYKSKDIKIIVKPDDEFKKKISTDSDILKNIIQDLLEVILKSVDMGELVIGLSTPNEEEISSKGLKSGTYTKISISSSALILSENDLECMFDPYRILDSTNRKNVLRAITLASVKNLVNALNGIVWVESQILKSTSLYVIIPEG